MAGSTALALDPPQFPAQYLPENSGPHPSSRRARVPPRIALVTSGMVSPGWHWSVTFPSCLFISMVCGRFDQRGASTRLQALRT